MNSVIYFITVNYHSSALIEELLASIRATGAADYRVLVVNNSPADTAVQALAAADVAVIEAAGNLGFGGGCNLGMEQAYRQDPTSILWLINPDARLTANAVAYVRQCFAQDPTIAILGTRIRDLDGQLWFSYGTFNPWLGTLKHRFDVDCSPEPVTTHPTRWVSGCSMIFHLPALQGCPSFDRQYFLDYEDADICERHRRQGDRLRVTQAVLVDHQVSAITHRNQRAKFQHATFSKLYFLYRHGTPLALGFNLIYMALKPLTLLPSRPDVAQGRWGGLLDFFRWGWGQLRGEEKPFQPRTSFTRAAAQSEPPKP